MCKKHKSANFLCGFCGLAFLSGFFLMVNFSNAFADSAMNREILTKYQMIEELKKEIAQIDSENARCQKMRNGWLAATIIGGVGVAATGTAAIIQASKLKDAPKTDQKDKPEKDVKSETETQGEKK